MSARGFASPDMRANYMHYGGFDAPIDLDCDFVVVDVETTGFEPSQGARVVEFAAHRTRGDGVITESFSTLIKPQGRNGEAVSPGATHIHGITAEMLEDAPTFDQVWPGIEHIMSDAVFVAHNASFDAAFVASEIDLMKAQVQWMPALCTVWLARQALPNLERHNLAVVSEHLGLVNHDAHNASADAAVVVEALPTLLGNVSTVKQYVRPTRRTSPVSVPVLDRSRR